MLVAGSSPPSPSPQPPLALTVTPPAASAAAAPTNTTQSREIGQATSHGSNPAAAHHLTLNEVRSPAASPRATLSVPAIRMAELSPDCDYEDSGLGFVSRTSLRRACSLSERPAALSVDSAAPGQVLVELTQYKGPTTAEDADTRVPDHADTLWRVWLPEVAKRFSDSAIDPSEPRLSLGLTSARAAELLRLNGPNELKPPKEHPEWIKYLLQYTDPFMILMTVAGILSACVAYPADTTVVINLYVGIVLWVVVFVSSTFSYVQEGKASDVMKSFKSMLPAQAKVMRDGKQVSIPARELVVGDVLLLLGGDVVPADMRVLWTQDCKVETSSLTGESLPITCSVQPGDAIKIEQARNVCFNSSKCLEGEAWGVVFATGGDSLIGRIAGLTDQTEHMDTTLQREIKMFVRNLTLFSICLGAVFFGIGISQGQHWVAAFINGFIVVLLGCVPQGLPMTVVSCLAITAKRLGEKKVFVKQLQSVETLGSVTVIATDKTGTLTQNLMTVANLWIDCTMHAAISVMQHYPPHHRIQRTFRPTSDSYAMGATLGQLERVAAIFSKARFEDERMLTEEQANQLEQVEMLHNVDPSMTMRHARQQYPTLYSPRDSNGTIRSGRNKLFASLDAVMMDDLQRVVVGDASETALFNFVRQRQSIELMRYHYPKVYEIPFNSRNKYALTIIKSVGLVRESPNKRTLLMKGAPEVILARCTHVMRRGELHPIDGQFKEEFTDTYEHFGNMGQRVLGFAMLDLPEDVFGAKFDALYASQPDAVPTTGLVFIGLMSLVDPPKESVPQAVLDCHSAGIKVIMVTGDHPLTAAAIARQVNIFQAGHFTRAELATIKDLRAEDVEEEDVDCVVVTGPEIDQFSDADWARVLAKDDIVFSRTTPQQKLQIVERLQAMNHVVAATGDGVNDSPALKKADIGVAMGINGSDVARDAGDIILLDDNFASIVVGVREGRTIFDNLMKTIAYTCTHGLPEVGPVLLTLAFGFPLALSSILLLTIDLFTEMPPAISLAYEPSEAEVMTRPPRNAKTDRLVTYQMVLYMVMQAGLIETLASFFGFFLVFRYYGMAIRSLCHTPYFQSSMSVDMPVFPGCQRLSDSDGPFAIGSVCYTKEEQELVLRQAQTCYYALVTFGQAFHIFMCKTRNVSIFTHGVLRNSITLWGVCIEICLILLIIFPPSSHAIFTSNTFPARFWLLICIAPVALFLWQEGRKLYVRRFPNSFVSKYIHW